MPTQRLQLPKQKQSLQLSAQLPVQKLQLPNTPHDARWRRWIERNGRAFQWRSKPPLPTIHGQSSEFIRF
jgi:hypothetical protein